ncbi:MAG: CapA family protein [Minisyncoccota bacterium]
MPLRTYIFLGVFVGASAFVGGVVYAMYTSSHMVYVSNVREIPTVHKEAIAPPHEVSLMFVGDIMLSRGIETVTKKEGDDGYMFDLVRQKLTEADVLFANLESPISDQGENVGSIYSFRADPQMIEALTGAGVDVVSFANNHVGDYGPAALLDTLTRLDAAGIKHSGAGVTFDAAHTPAVVEANGLKIAYLAYTNIAPAFYQRLDSEPAVADIKIETITKDIARAKSVYHADIVVVSYHWGQEYATQHSAWQESIAHATIDAGATMVIGHHPHVIQEVEQYRGGIIAYSLGNFVFDQNFSPDTQKGLALRVGIRDGAIADVQELPVSFTKTYQPFFTTESTTSPLTLTVKLK